MIIQGLFLCISKEPGSTEGVNSIEQISVSLVILKDGEVLLIVEVVGVGGEQAALVDEHLSLESAELELLEHALQVRLRDQSAPVLHLRALVEDGLEVHVDLLLQLLHHQQLLLLLHILVVHQQLAQPVAEQVVGDGRLPRCAFAQDVLERGLAKALLEGKGVFGENAVHLLVRDLVVLAGEHLGLQLLEGELEALEAALESAPNEVEVAQLALRKVHQLLLLALQLLLLVLGDDALLLAQLQEGLGHRQLVLLAHAASPRQIRQVAHRHCPPPLYVLVVALALLAPALAFAAVGLGPLRHVIVVGGDQDAAGAFLSEVGVPIVGVLDALDGDLHALHRHLFRLLALLERGLCAFGGGVAVRSLGGLYESNELVLEDVNLRVLLVHGVVEQLDLLSQHIVFQLDLLQLAHDLLEVEAVPLHDLCHDRLHLVLVGLVELLRLRLLLRHRRAGGRCVLEWLTLCQQRLRHAQLDLQLLALHLPLAQLPPQRLHLLLQPVLRLPQVHSFIPPILDLVEILHDHLLVLRILFIVQSARAFALAFSQLRQFERVVNFLQILLKKDSLLLDFAQQKLAVVARARRGGSVLVVVNGSLSGGAWRCFPILVTDFQLAFRGIEFNEASKPSTLDGNYIIGSFKAILCLFSSRYSSQSPFFYLFLQGEYFYLLLDADIFRGRNYTFGFAWFIFLKKLLSSFQYYYYEPFRSIIWELLAKN